MRSNRGQPGKSRDVQQSQVCPASPPNEGSNGTDFFCLGVLEPAVPHEAQLESLDDLLAQLDAPVEACVDLIAGGEQSIDDLLDSLVARIDEEVEPVPIDGRTYQIEEVEYERPQLLEPIKYLDIEYPLEVGDLHFCDFLSALGITIGHFRQQS